MLGIFRKKKPASQVAAWKAKWEANMDVLVGLHIEQEQAITRMNQLRIQGLIRKLANENMALDHKIQEHHLNKMEYISGRMNATQLKRS